ncbi:General transcription factor IIF subunit 1 [Trichoplax sp. H2]|nr:General transcription factor IIF subunit 1 [Trichoplax sp. H2]|eukprot:RDD46496.1 General transcription factor IIF subunit 1 [Trichoplax sp. H2]
MEKKLQSNVFPLHLKRLVDQEHLIMQFGHPKPSWKEGDVTLYRQQIRSSHPDTEEVPEFGEGSAYRYHQREELKRKRRSRSGEQNINKLPWFLDVGDGDNAKKFKGSQEGDIQTNSDYYLMTQSSNGAFQVAPVTSFIKFYSIPKYYTLNIDEAEEQMQRNEVIYDHFNFMTAKRIKQSENDKQSPSSEVRLRLVERKTNEKSSSSSDYESEDESKAKARKRKQDALEAKKHKSKYGKIKVRGDEDDAESEVSDDAESEGFEVDYMSDTVSSNEEIQHKEDKPQENDGIPDEIGGSENSVYSSDENDEDLTKSGLEMKKLLNRSDNDNSDSDIPEDFDADEELSKSTVWVQNKDKKKISSEESSSSSEEESVNKSTKAKKTAAIVAKAKNNALVNLADRADFPTRVAKEKNKRSSENQPSKPAKRVKTEVGNREDSSSIASEIKDYVTPEAVARYLKRKPMTTSELIKKFKKYFKDSKDKRSINFIAEIIRKLNPERKVSGGATYFYLK